MKMGSLRSVDLPCCHLKLKPDQGDHLPGSLMRSGTAYSLKIFMGPQSSHGLENLGTIFWEL